MSFPNTAPPPLRGAYSKKGDFSGASILVGNAVTILITLYQGWDLGPLLLIYWAQSVIIGGFHFFRILLLNQFCAEGCTYDSKPIPETKKGKYGTALFFAIHYGFFHLVYFFFIGDPKYVGEVSGDAAPLWVGGGILAFLISHAISFFRNVRDDLNRRPNIGKLMYLPYLRIVPMHLTLMCIGALNLKGGSWALIVFLLIRAGADYLSHIAEHRIFQKANVDRKGNHS